MYIAINISAKNRDSDLCLGQQKQFTFLNPWLLITIYDRFHDFWMGENMIEETSNIQ